MAENRGDLTQDEIDALINGHVSGDASDERSTEYLAYAVNINKKYRAYNAAKKRYYFALKNLSFGKQK